MQDRVLQKIFFCKIITRSKSEAEEMNSRDQIFLCQQLRFQIFRNQIKSWFKLKSWFCRQKLAAAAEELLKKFLQAHANSNFFAGEAWDGLRWLLRPVAVLAGVAVMAVAATAASFLNYGSRLRTRLVVFPCCRKVQGEYVGRSFITGALSLQPKH